MIDKELFNKAYNQAKNKIINENYTSKVNNLKYYLSIKFPEKEEIFSKCFYLYQLYKMEVEIIFNQNLLERYNKIREKGYPKKCPANKFIYQTKLF